MTVYRRLWHRVLATQRSLLIFLLTAKCAFAHPMGNFSINHYTRLEVSGDHITGRYVLDMAEIPTVSEMTRLDANGDGKVSPEERAAYLRLQGAALSSNLSLTVNGQTTPLNALPDEMALRPGAGGLQTLRLVLKLSANLPAVASGRVPRNAEYKVKYRDDNFATRTGWKEVVVRNGAGLTRGGGVSGEDISRELTVYPSDPGIVPPQTTQAQFTVAAPLPNNKGAEKGGQNPATNSLSVFDCQSTSHHPQFQRVNSATPQDRFTQSIAMQGLTPTLMLLSLGSAFVFGALHALSPGHGKTMVAAYLVGTRGTAWHAVLLGLVVTLTHTAGVFVLGLITLSASKHIVPERLYPILSGLSGVGVTCMGLGLLWSRVAAWQTAQREADESGSGDGESGGSETEASEADEFYHQRRNSDSVSLRTLIGLGITGGALPCPSALVVMLSAIALHRIAFGLLLIVSFSLGLAAVLMVLGLLMMRARGMVERFPARGRILAGLSVVSAGVVIVIGLILFVRALSGGF